MRRVLGSFVAIAFLAAASIASAQDFPNRVITIVVPYPPGGPTDATGRVVAAGLSARLGQQVVVENVSGGGANIGASRVARSAPDGYTLLVTNMAIASSVSLFPNLSFDTEKDLLPIGLINSNGNIIVGRKSLPPNNLQEFIAWMRSGVQVKFAHPGLGNMGHLCAALFVQAIGAKNVDYIPYRGGAPATQDVIAGHADLFCSTTQLVIEPIRAGTVKAYGISAPERLPQLPDVPSLVQEVDPRLDIKYWHALFAPAGTPRPIVDRLNAALQEVVTDPRVKNAWEQTGVLIYPKEERTPEAAAALFRSEIKRWGEVIRENKIEAPQ
jgi:tripartite-type tricarboxylate transporter receptor subunit TctC